MTFCYMSGPITETLSGNIWDKYRDLQLDNIQTIRDIGTLSPKRYVSII